MTRSFLDGRDRGAFRQGKVLGEDADAGVPKPNSRGHLYTMIIRRRSACLLTAIKPGARKRA
jgi:hypothetical protein